MNQPLHTTMTQTTATTMTEPSKSGKNQSSSAGVQIQPDFIGRIAGREESPIIISPEFCSGVLEGMGVCAGMFIRHLSPQPNSLDVSGQKKRHSHNNPYFVGKSCLEGWWSRGGSNP